MRRPSVRARRAPAPQSTAILLVGHMQRILGYSMPVQTFYMLPSPWWWFLLLQSVALPRYCYVDYTFSHRAVLGFLLLLAESVSRAHLCCSLFAPPRQLPP